MQFLLCDLIVVGPIIVEVFNFVNYLFITLKAKNKVFIKRVDFLLRWVPLLQGNLDFFIHAPFFPVGLGCPCKSVST